jgi:murein DD-endopeptidase MepM/ murein hydrolase activator NlpD
MQRLLDRGRWLSCQSVVFFGTALLIAACSTYRPLDQGAQVPWADEGAPQIAERGPDRSGDRATGEPQTATLPDDGYRVRPGDRLSTLARSHGLSVRALAEVNQLAPPYVIYVGQVLHIPASSEPAATQPKPAAQPKPAVAASGDRYVVRRGDTLSDIATKVDRSMVELAAINGLKPPYHVYAGQSLRISDQDGVASEASTPAGTVHQVADGKPPRLSGDGFLWPVNGKVIGGFGRGEHGQRRDGIDIAARRGAPVLAAEHGVVVYAGDSVRGYGRMILLRHANGYVTAYAHNATLLVGVGDVVERGQVIARVGATGDVTQSQLHFELRKGRKPINPETVLVRDAATTTAVASTQ